MRATLMRVTQKRMIKTKTTVTITTIVPLTTVPTSPTIGDVGTSTCVDIEEERGRETTALVVITRDVRIGILLTTSILEL